ncbi:MAG: FliG C-terminal domain-containing protein [Planctomycetaceae bacterium]
MTSLSIEDRVAILLKVLGDDLAQPVMEHLSAEKKQRVRQRQLELSELSLSDPQVSEVLTDFDRFFNRSKRSPELTLHLAPGTVPDRKATERLGDPRANSAAYERSIQPGDDPADDLESLEPPQIAAALQGENPQTIALVLNCLNPEKAANALEQLPEEIRSDVFLRLSRRPAGSRELMKRIVSATVEKGRMLIREDPVAESSSDQKVADVLRAMPRLGRAAMLGALMEKDPEAAGRVKSLLYVFEDLLRIENRSLQRLLTEIESATLAVALKDTGEDLTEKVMSNMSQRARTALSEEIEMTGVVTAERRDEARKSIMDVIVRMDEAGELVMTE